VFVAADYATELAGRYGGDAVVARAAAMLHDIADVKMAKRGKAHEAESRHMARELMKEVGFDNVQIQVVVDDALPYHSCHGDERPATLEGKILATADAMAHLQTDFYLHATWAFGGERTLADVKAWTLEKIRHGLDVKTFFEEVRAELRPSYELLRQLYSR
jgi:HD superfamily phosphodiesterase